MKQHFISGKKVLLIFNDGHQEVGKVHHAEKGIIYFSDRSAVKMSQIRSASYYKPSK